VYGHGDSPGKDSQRLARADTTGAAFASTLGAPGNTVPARLPEAAAAVGPAFRVPLFIVSPWAPANTVFKGSLDHTSILQFIERTFSTARRPVTLSTIAPERRELADLTQAFNFDQEPNIPTLPIPAQLHQSAQQTVLLLNLERTATDCSTNIPSWLAPLLGV
jgi:phospholipase C